MNPPAAPPRTIDQRMTALDRANLVRTRRKEMKIAVKGGRQSFAEVLNSGVPWLQTMRIRDLLLTTPKLGLVKTDRAMRACRISTGKTVGGITARQRAELLTYLRTHFPTVENQTKEASVLRQGDILLVPVKDLPDGLTEVPREDGRIILAEGEATGHLHAIDAPEATFLATDIAEIEGRFLAIEDEAVALVHPEHDTVTLEPGNYEVRRQREYTAAGGIELVAD